ncbi:uncharacterized protein LOC142357994 [Convolutriloba macropyga]|uniref:uncharacterized protein LOC142357994 n=1 Tax=Convolutriloba macropyga TaxID=536237 RepID=UPI003F51C6FA
MGYVIHFAINPVIYMASSYYFRHKCYSYLTLILNTLSSHLSAFWHNLSPRKRKKNNNPDHLNDLPIKQEQTFELDTIIPKNLNNSDCPEAGPIDPAYQWEPDLTFTA